MADDEKLRLRKCQEAILKRGLATKQADSLKKEGISVDRFVAPSTDWKEIKCYTRINMNIKDNFKSYLSDALLIIELEDMPTNKATGQEWDKILSNYLTKETDEEEKKMAGTSSSSSSSSSSEKEEKMAETLICQLKKTHGGLRFLKSKFRIFGFMRDNAVAKKPKSYLWQGEADAIAFYKGKYTIVDFKVINSDILGYQSATDLCGKHLHQCLIYAQLLKLHMDLEYLPPILIVVIDRYQGGRQICPPLFTDYPTECKDKLDSFEWSKEDFTEKPPLELTVDDGKLFKKGISGDINAKEELTNIFLAGATLKDLLDMLGYGSLKLKSKE